MNLPQTWKTKVFKQERKLKRSSKTGKIVVVGFWTLCIGVIYFSFQAYNRTAFLNEKINNLQHAATQQIQSLNQTNFISSPAAVDFAKQFANTYINVPSDQQGRDSRNQNLGNYLANGLTTDKLEDLSGFTGKRNVTDIALYKLTDVTKNSAVIEFRVKYDVITIQGNNESSPVSNQALLLVPIGTDGTNFNIIEQPSFQSIPASAHLTAVTNQSNGMNQNYKNVDKMKNFATQFFTSYTDNTVEEMSYLMENPSSLKGLYTFQGIENFTLYNGKGNQLILKMLVDLKDASSSFIVKEPCTLTVVKQNGKYFVQKINFSIGGN